MFEELPRMRRVDEKTTGSGPLAELLKEKGIHAVTADDEVVFVIMTLEQYVAILPVNPNPSRQPKMVRVEGVLYRECI